MKVAIIYLKVILFVIIGINFECTRQLYLQSSYESLPPTQYFTDPDNDGNFNFLILRPKLEYYQNTGDYMKKFESGFNKHSNTTDKSISGIMTLDVFVDVTGFVDSIKVKRSLSLERDIQFIQTFKEATMAGYAILRVKSKAVAYRMEQSASVGQTNKND